MIGTLPHDKAANCGPNRCLRDCQVRECRPCDGSLRVEEGRLRVLSALVMAACVWKKGDFEPLAPEFQEPNPRLSL